MENIDKIPKGNPFRVPDNYFEELNKRIIGSTVEPHGKIERKGIYLKLRPYLAVAASVAILLVLSYTGIRLFSPGEKILSLSNIQIEDYSDMILNDVDLLTLEQNTVLREIPETEPQVDREIIIEYLLFENIDIDEIQENL